MKQILEKQHQFRWEMKTWSLEHRINLLRLLKSEIRDREADIIEALALDFQKPALESLLTEINPVIAEIDCFLKHLSSWSKPKAVATGLLFLGTKARVYREAKGQVLIISPWNYPFALALVPLIGALASGNCVALKPSELTPRTSQLIQDLLEKIFLPECVSVFQGDAKISEELLNWPFDHIFFTGSSRVGKLVMKAASQNLCPVTLELGGKSPAIVDESCDLALSARKLVWGKFLNSGQTCVAPDYILVQKSIQNQFVAALQSEINRQWNGRIQACLITQSHRDRLLRLLENCKGQILLAESSAPAEARRMPPTLVINPNPDSQLMQEEIFGPIWPILSFEHLPEAIDFVRARPKPLALYLFSKNSKNQNQVLQETSSGGACINDNVIHLGNHNLPFGGVGESGFGNYHGEASFKTFTHEKSVLKQGPFTKATSIFYPPYTEKKFSRLRKILNL